MANFPGKRSQRQRVGKLLKISPPPLSKNRLARLPQPIPVLTQAHNPRSKIIHASDKKCDKNLKKSILNRRTKP